MEKFLYIVIIILAIALIVLLAAITVFLFRYLKIREAEKKENFIGGVKGFSANALSSKMPKEVKDAIDQSKEVKFEGAAGGFCVDHPDLHSKGMCAISNKLYCELCLTKEKDVKIARKFLNLFLDHKWPVKYMINNSNVGADKLNEVMRVKKELWNSSQIPVITQKQFKINIETDDIETFTVVMIRDKDKVITEQRFGFLDEE